MATMENLRNLMAKKEAMEKEMADNRKFLDDLRVGMTGSLVDNEGYPRADIDLYAVRNARHRVNCLQNDLRSLLKEIEEQLHILHNSGEAGGEASNGQQNGDGPNPMSIDDQAVESGNAEQPAPHRTSNEPFLKIDEIVGGSPAATAGLVDGDLVIQFGSICKTNFSQMQQVAEIVQNSAGRPIRLTVLREDHAVRLSLTPKRWGGQGLLGCRATPYRD